MVGRVLVFGGETYKGLAIARALHKEGLFVGVVGGKKHSMAFYSRACDRKYFLPKWDLKKIKDIIVEGKYDLVIPVSEEGKMDFIRERKFFDKYCVLPDVKSMRIAADKSKMMVLAGESEVLVPKTIFPRSLDDAKKKVKNIRFPVIIKPSTMEQSGPRPRYVFLEREFEEAYAQYDKNSKNPLVQEVIRGVGFGTFLMCKDGKVLQYFCHERLIEQDPCGAGSARCKSCKLTPELKSASDKIAKALKWSGEIMLEFKRDDRTKKFYLIETNPRFWGSIPLAIFAKINFPYQLYELKTKGKITGQKTWQETFSRYFVGELVFLARVFRGRPKDWKLDFPTRRQALRRVFSGPWKNFFVFDLKDPKPFFFDIYDNLRRIFKNG
jgi:carbamoylphosphate synthase large subunit